MSELMNDIKLTAMGEAADFLCENGIPRFYLRDLLNISFEAHEWTKVFGLTEENNFKITIKVDNKDIDATAYTFLSNICAFKTKETGYPWNVVDEMNIMDNKKNKYKVTKLFSRAMFRWLWDNGRAEAVSSLLNEAGLMVCCLDCMIKSADETKTLLTKFPVWYGDRSKTERIIVISSHPVDLLTASSNASFKSCYRPDGEWFNGVIASIMSPGTIIASIEDPAVPGYKLGRSWVYVNQDFVTTGRKYGAITAAHHKTIRDYLTGCLGGEWWHYRDIKIGAGHILMQGPGYLDAGEGETSFRSGKGYADAQKVIIPKAMCLYCGLLHNNCGRKGMCNGCFSKIKPEDYQ